MERAAGAALLLVVAFLVARAVHIMAADGPQLPTRPVREAQDRAETSLLGTLTAEPLKHPRQRSAEPAPTMDDLRNRVELLKESLYIGGKMSTTLRRLAVVESGILQRQASDLDGERGEAPSE